MYNPFNYPLKSRKLACLRRKALLKDDSNCLLIDYSVFNFAFSQCRILPHRDENSGRQYPRRFFPAFWRIRPRLTKHRNNIRRFPHQRYNTSIPCIMTLSYQFSGLVSASPISAIFTLSLSNCINGIIKPGIPLIAVAV